MTPVRSGARSRRWGSPDTYEFKWTYAGPTILEFYSIMASGAQRLAGCDFFADRYGSLNTAIAAGEV